MYEQVLEKLYEIRFLQNLFFIGVFYLSIMLYGRRKWFSAIMAFLVGVLWFFYMPSIAYIVGNLGADSFAEAKDFDLNEALFWISTIVQSLEPPPGSTLLFVQYLVILAVIFYLTSQILKRLSFEKYRSIAQASIAFILMILSLVVVFKDSVGLFIKNSNELETARKNFDNQIPELYNSADNVDVVVYIGESLSVFNMGVYGYPRNTTPNLSEMAQDNRNMIVFHNVFSTHTHTSQSLLEAFSFPVDSDEDILPIIHRKRISLVDVLRKAGLRTRLISNQGMTGTWNEASSIIFRNAEKTFSVENGILGNNEEILKKPWDHEFFMSRLSIDNARKSADQPVITFLHSYAGHGPYLENIPENFRKPVDDYFSVNASKRISESDIEVRGQIEEYDSAVKYVDYSIAKVIDHIKKQEKPTVLVLFSDHGESVYTGRGHDSSRFIHEMARIPFIVCFNDAAIEQYPALYKRYRKLSETREIATLAQLSPVIMDLAGIRFNDESYASKNSNLLLGEKRIHPPIIVREVKSGLTYVNLNKSKGVFRKNFGYRITDGTDPATAEFVRSRGMKINLDSLVNESNSSFERKRRHQLMYGE
jgi:heptose-I-phosphate ethanolaminephosphotransferase